MSDFVTDALARARGQLATLPRYRAQAIAKADAAEAPFFKLKEATLPNKEAVDAFLNNLPATEGAALAELSDAARDGVWNGATILACRAGIADHFAQTADTLRDARFTHETGRL